MPSRTLLSSSLAVLLCLSCSLTAADKKSNKADETSKPSYEQPQPAAENLDYTMYQRIRDEGLSHSHVMEYASALADGIGPRLTGSPNLKRANEWTCQTLTKWGLSNAHLEAWGPFGKGWTLKRFSAQVIEPQCIPLIAFPKAWSPSTDGTLVAPVIYFDAKTEADFAKFKGKVKGAIVLTGPTTEVSPRFEPLANRLTDKELLELVIHKLEHPPARFRVLLNHLYNPLDFNFQGTAVDGTGVKAHHA